MGEKPVMNTNFDTVKARKGQSAIEYLMTYGWMLLVVAIVGGAIFATVQGQCQKASSMTGGVSIASFGVATDGQMSVELRNMQADPVNVTEVTISSQEGAQTASLGSSVQINVGSSKTVTIGSGGQFGSANGCNTFNINVTYDQIGGIENQAATGTITGAFEFK
ncbi:MAG: hypothetical protein ABEJ93_00055 [Candidatus Nanohalobium sp.]